MKINKNLILASVITFLLIVFISSYITSAFLISGTFRIKGAITTGGHVNLTIGSPIKNMSMIAVGQPVIGNVSGGNFKICFGVFCTDIYQPQYSMNFSGNLNYSNGTFVANTPINVVLNYGNSQYEGNSWTNGYGNFFIKIENLPEYIMNDDLNITIFVQGDIEAIYSCWYNHSSTKCCTTPLSSPCV